MPGVVPPQVQDSALLVELHKVPVGPFLQPVEVPLDSSMTLWCVSHSSQFRIISKLAEGTLCPITQIISKDVEKDWTQYWPPVYTASYWPPARLRAADHHPLGMAIHPVFNAPHCLLISGKGKVLLLSAYLLSCFTILPPGISFSSSLPFEAAFETVPPCTWLNLGATCRGKWGEKLLFLIYPVTEENGPGW